MSIDYRNLGDSGLRVSTIGLGCNNFGRPGTATEGQEGTTAVLEAALDAGVTLFDTADIYGYAYGRSETMMGEALAGPLRGRRDGMVLATKFGHADFESPIASWGAKASRRYVRLAVEGSLRRLQTEWIDLYQLHTPDPHTPIEETLDVLDDLIREGKVRYIGHSNLTGWQIAEADYEARLAGHPRFVSAQNEYSLVARDVEREVLPAVRAFGLGFLPYFPLHNGLFTGKFSRSGGPADSRIMRQRPHVLEKAPWEAIEEYERMLEGWGVSMLEGTFGWLLAQENLTSVIAGATTPEQVRQNAASATAWAPTAEEVEAISRLFAVSS